jgi:hypothetical protein
MVTSFRALISLDFIGICSESHCPMHQVLLGRHNGTSGLDCIFLAYLFLTSETFAFHAPFYFVANGIHACTTSSSASASGLLLAGNPFFIAVVFLSVPHLRFRRIRPALQGNRCPVHPEQFDTIPHF